MYFFPAFGSSFYSEFSLWSSNTSLTLYLNNPLHLYYSSFQNIISHLAVYRLFQFVSIPFIVLSYFDHHWEYFSKRFQNWFFRTPLVNLQPVSSPFQDQQRLPRWSRYCKYPTVLVLGYIFNTFIYTHTKKIIWPIFFFLLAFWQMLTDNNSCQGIRLF